MVISTFYQWDKDQYISPGVSAQYVDFLCANVLYKVTPDEDGKYRIPSAILNVAGNYKWFASDGTNTIASGWFTVIARPMPDEYQIDITDLVEKVIVLEDVVSQQKEDIADLIEKVGDQTSSFTDYVKTSLLDALTHVAWTDEHGATYIRNLQRALDGKTEDDPIEVTGIEFEETSGIYYAGDTFVVVANVLPVDATDKGITWESDDTSVAEVADGSVTVKNAGDCTITARTNDGGYEATYSLTAKAQKQIVSFTRSDFVEDAQLNSSEPDYTIVPVTGDSFAGSRRAKFRMANPADGNMNVHINITTTSKYFLNVHVGSWNPSTNMMTNAVSISGTGAVPIGTHELDVVVNDGEYLCIAPITGASPISDVNGTMEG